MNRNRVSNDLDHVDYESIVTKKTKKLSSKQWSMSKYKPLKIKNELQYDLDKLSSNVLCQSYSIFNLFFIESIFETLIKNINKYATNHFSHDQEDKSFARIWFDTTIFELRAFIAIYIYMNVNNEFRIEQYWNTDCAKNSLHSSVTRYISLKIDRFFHISKHFEEKNVFEKINHLSEHLRKRFKLYWISNIHLIVDESIQRFMSRINETVNIFSKFEFENFKIWILINVEYVLDWMYHAKDDKRDFVDLNEIYIKKWNFSKIQTMIFDLLQQEDIFDHFQHVVWLNNLFTSIRLLFKLKKLNFEIAKIVRTTKIRREMFEIEIKEKVQKQQKKKNRDLFLCLFDLKLKHEIQMK